MSRKVLLLDKEIYGEYFKGLILPEEREKIENEETFLIGAMEDGQPLGASLWELEASRARLLSIAVESKHRRMGIGTAILRYSMKVLHQLDCYGVYALVLPEEDNAFQPSRYTQKMIQRLDKKIEKQKIFVESEYQKVLNPVQDEMMSEKIKK